MIDGTPTAPTEDTTASNWGGLVFGALFVTIVAALMYALIVLWPDGGTVQGGSFDLVGGWTWHLTADQQLLVLVALAGALGGFVNSLQLLSKYVGDGTLKWRYGLSYAVQPVAGAAIALIFYIVIRAGFVNFDQVKDLNTYGYLGLSLLAGLFVDQAMGKLRGVAGALFTDPSPPVNPGGGGAAVAVPKPKTDDGSGGDAASRSHEDVPAEDDADILEAAKEKHAMTAAEQHERTLERQRILRERAKNIAKPK